MLADFSLIDRQFLCPFGKGLILPSDWRQIGVVRTLAMKRAQ